MTVEILLVGKALDRAKQECCPVHNVACGQTGLRRDERGNPLGVIVSCTRKDCDVEIGYSALNEPLWAQHSGKFGGDK